MDSRALSTTCCIAGGGPAGIMLALLLARSGIEVIVLEKWPDFFRDFRGDTIHPSTLQVLRELGLYEKFLALPHNETKEIAVHFGQEEIVIADFAHLNKRIPFLGFIPQWDFLNFLCEEGKKYPGFKVLMETEAIDLIREKGNVVGVRARDKDGEFDIRASLVVGADGRHSVVREKAALEVEDLGAPIDVLWFRLPRRDDGIKRSLGYANHGHLMVMIDRDTYWQCGFLINKGGFDAIKEKGIDAFRMTIVSLVPALEGSVSEIDSWEKIKLLSVSVDHLKRWYAPGVLCVGDSAHAMSPVGGVGINLAVQDAVAAANILVPAFRRSVGVELEDLEVLQKRRAWPALVIQKMQVLIHTRAMKPLLAHDEEVHTPPFMRAIFSIPWMRRIPAYLVGVGPRPEHIGPSLRPKI